MAANAVRVIAQFTVQADKVEQFITAAQATLVIPSRRDAGCLSYDLWQESATPTRFVMVEAWESAAALQAHLAQPALQQAVAALRPMGAGPVEVHHYHSVTPER